MEMEGIYSARLLAFNFLGAADPVEFEEQYEIKELNEGQPSLPTELTLTPMDNTVTFEWKEGLNGGHEQTFVLETSLNSGDSWTNRFTIKESESKYLNENGKFKVNLPNLDPGVYKARLVAFNIIGAADPVEFKKRFEIIKLNQDQSQSEVRADIPDNTHLYMPLDESSSKSDVHYQNVKKEDPVYNNTVLKNSAQTGL
ncbi:hypothetical protein MAR_020661 [Mya arenaria]|uniref:Uncharacterized protein n=1 Tax=Mya arenaria TaxID=6604 RepID=A0ABY7E8Z8_MYAAR|nr:hypothetical protein MAR_020661 [Mya arenaria]